MSDVQSMVRLLQMNNYIFVAQVTGVVYDYFLTFSREVEYIWCKPWSWVSTLFVLIRYLGIYQTVANGLANSPILSGPKEEFPRCFVIFLISNWAYPIWITAADWIMVLRVYAMWHRSKGILCLLVFMLIIQSITLLVYIGIYFTPPNFIVSIARVLDIPFCTTTSNISPLFNVYFSLPRLSLSFTLLFLCVLSTLKQSVQMYKATKQWQPSRYLKVLVKDGTVYFIGTTFTIILGALPLNFTVTNPITSLFLDFFSYVPLVPMVPRFIIGIRELYDRDFRGRIQGIDTGFGMFSQPLVSRGTSTTAVSAMAFADNAPVQDQSMEEYADGLTRLERLGDRDDVDSRR